LSLSALGCSGPAPEELHRQSQSLYQKGRIGKAKALLAQALEKDPKNPLYWKDLGNIYLTGYKNLQRAEQYYRKALEIKPGYPNARHNLALIQKKRGHKKKAKKIFADIIHKHPDFHFSYIELANLYLEDKKPRQALLMVQKALELKPNFGKSLYLKALILSRHLNQPQKALTIIQKALQQKPIYGPSYLLAASIQKKMNQIDKARQALLAYRKHLKQHNPKSSKIEEIDKRLQNLSP
jgi:tetratricopeptide (TPR) repeat protein